jgi:hypothetical protein
LKVFKAGKMRTGKALAMVVEREDSFRNMLDL